MKKINPVAIIIAATIITLISCEWFTHSNKKAVSIIGNWKVDSVFSAKKDSGNADAVLLFLKTVNKDTFFVQFNVDSTFKETIGRDLQKYYQKDSTLFIKSDSSFIPLAIHSLNDSCISLVAKDSTTFYLRKK